MNHELVLVLDFGGQYNQLIARRVRNLNVYCEVIPFNTPLDEIIAKKPKGIIFTGGPNVVFQEDAPTVDKKIFDIGIPILGICYGCQLIAYLNDGEIGKAEPREYGKTSLFVKNENPLFNGFNKESICWMSHTYYITKVPPQFEIIAETKNCFSAAIFNSNKKLYGVQFHPEVIHTEFGNTLIKNFLYEICKCSGDWVIKNIADDIIQNIKQKFKDKKALCALSGGVDSAVAAILVHKAIGKNLTCVFVDHGLLRLNEGDEVENSFSEFGLNLIRVNAEDRFLNKLKNVSDPEEKRKIIGEEFIRVFEEESKKIGAVDYLIQGTIYSDVIESGTKSSLNIKSHHNVGGLPDVIDFKEIVEPLKNLFKDEVRELGYELNMPKKFVERQPFPGPGLAIRIIGEITKEKLEILRKTDFIFRDEIEKANLSKEVWQYFTVLTNNKSVGVMGDERTYEYTIALRAVTSVDAMTADWAKIPYNILEKISIRLVNEVDGINRVVYDITSKPPATIEWE